MKSKKNRERRSNAAPAGTSVAKPAERRASEPPGDLASATSEPPTRSDGPRRTPEPMTPGPSANVVMLWLLVPFVAVILYGLLSR